jgi:hypothetical protein
MNNIFSIDIKSVIVLAIVQALANVMAIQILIWLSKGNKMARLMSKKVNALLGEKTK